MESYTRPCFSREESRFHTMKDHAEVVLFARAKMRVEKIPNFCIAKCYFGTSKKKKKKI